MGKFRHEDHHAELRQREAIFARLRNQLMREGSNPSAFKQAKARVMSLRDVQADPVLARQLQAFIAEREMGFRIAHRAEAAAEARAIPTSHFTKSAPTPTETLLREARHRLAAFERQFREEVVHFREEEARMVLDRIRALLREYPDLTGEVDIVAHDATLARMSRKRNDFNDRINQFVEKAVASAREGRHETAARLLKRFASINALHPALLTDERFAAIRERIVHAGEAGAHADTLRRLMERERAVAAELRQLAAHVRTFHAAARAMPHDAAEYRRAERQYRQAVRAIKAHDADWLAALILELLDLLAELHDPPPPKAQAQVDRFVESVRAALRALHRDVNKLDESHGS